MFDPIRIVGFVFLIAFCCVQLWRWYFSVRCWGCDRRTTTATPYTGHLYCPECYKPVQQHLPPEGWTDDMLDRLWKDMEREHPELKAFPRPPIAEVDIDRINAFTRETIRQHKARLTTEEVNARVDKLLRETAPVLDPQKVLQAFQEGMSAKSENVTRVTDAYGKLRWKTDDGRFLDTIQMKDSAGGLRWTRADMSLHREGGPAVEFADGTWEWWIDGKRLDPQPTKEAGVWTFRDIEGQRHRTDGPAVIWTDPNGDRREEWWAEGLLLTEKTNGQTTVWPLCGIGL